MNEPCEMEPVIVRMVEANGFRRLQQVLNLRLLEIGVAVVHAVVEELTTLPDAHHFLVELQVLPPHLLHLRPHIGWFELGMCNTTFLT